MDALKDKMFHCPHCGTDTQVLPDHLREVTAEDVRVIQLDLYRQHPEVADDDELPPQRSFA